jgi:hypothetical protein
MIFCSITSSLAFICSSVGNFWLSFMFMCFN